MRGEEDVLKLIEEMFISSIKFTQNNVLREHGLLLADEGGGKYLMGKHIEVLRSLPMIAAVQAMTIGGVDKLEPFVLSTAIEWGYSQDESKLQELWRRYREKPVHDISPETIDKCVEKINELITEDQDVETVMPELSDVCWITGCQLGAYFNDLGKVMEGVR